MAITKRKTKLCWSEILNKTAQWLHRDPSMGYTLSKGDLRLCTARTSNSLRWNKINSHIRGGGKRRGGGGRGEGGRGGGGEGGDMMRMEEKRKSHVLCLLKEHIKSIWSEASLVIQLGEASIPFLLPSLTDETSAKENLSPLSLSFYLCLPVYLSICLSVSPLSHIVIL